MKKISIEINEINKKQKSRVVLIKTKGFVKGNTILNPYVGKEDCNY